MTEFLKKALSLDRWKTYESLSKEMRVDAVALYARNLTYSKELYFGFWTHLVDAPYEQTLWLPAIRGCFKNKPGRPVRQDIESRLKNLLRYRNKIAHLEPIIRHESQLMQVYQNAYDVMSWICPETANWFDKQNSFKREWEAN